MPGNFNAKEQVGKKVRLARTVWAGNDKILPRGLVLKAVGFGSALHLATGPCPACGIELRLSNVPKRYLETCQDGAVPEWPVRAVWADSEDPESPDSVHCAKCGFISSAGYGYKDHAVGPGPVGERKLHWRFCPGCGAGMALPEDIDPGAVETAETYIEKSCPDGDGKEDGL